MTTKGDIAITIALVSAIIGTGVFYVIKGLSHNSDLSYGIAILCFCAAFCFVSESKGMQEIWKSAKEVDE